MKDYAYSKALIYFKVAQFQSSVVSTASLLVSLSSAPTKRPCLTPSQWSSSPSFVECGFIRRPGCLRYFRARDLLSLTPSQWHSNPSSISTLAPSSQSSEVPSAISTPTSSVVLAKQSSHYPFRPLYHRSRMQSPFSISKQYTLNPCSTRPAVPHPTVASSPSVSPSKSPRLASLRFPEIHSLHQLLHDGST